MEKIYHFKESEKYFKKENGYDPPREQESQQYSVANCTYTNGQSATGHIQPYHSSSCYCQPMLANVSSQVAQQGLTYYSYGNIDGFVTPDRKVVDMENLYQANMLYGMKHLDVRKKL